MKNYRKPAPSKLVAKYDTELMSILMEDLKIFRAKNPQIRKVDGQRHLSAA